MATILMVVAPQDFQEEELKAPKAVFEDHGYSVKIASEKVQSAKGRHGEAIDVDADIHDVDAADFVAVVFVGGRGARVYFDNAKALNLARQAAEQGKTVGAICVAPTILANAGLLKGRRATSFKTEKARLVKSGADWVEEDVVVDGNIITARGSTVARAFGEAIAKALNEPEREPLERERHMEGRGHNKRKTR